MPTGRYCRTCSYDLRQSFARCPECGRPFDPANPRTFAKKPASHFLVRWLRRIAVTTFAIAFLLALTWSWFYWGWHIEQSALASMKHLPGRFAGPSTAVEPIGGNKLHQLLGPAGFVLERVRTFNRNFADTHEFSDADFPQLAKLDFVTRLNLSGTDTTDIGLIYLQYFPKLRDLDLSHTAVTDAGLTHLLYLTNLETLDLTFTAVTDAGLASLSQLPALKRVSLPHAHVTPAALRFFPPSVMVTVSGLPNYQKRVPGTLGQILPVPFAPGPDPLANAQSFEIPFDPPFGAARDYFLPGEKVGTRIFYSNGKIAVEALQRNGQVQVSRQFYESGKLFAEFPYTNGKLNGTVRYFKENGDLLGQSTLINGTGTLRRYKLMPVSTEDSQTPLKDGLIEGVVRFWGHVGDRPGIGCNVTLWVHGAENGWSVSLDQDNKMVRSTYWRDGKHIGVYREFTAAGTLAPGFPKFILDSQQVPEAAYRLAAQKDPILQLSLTDDGYTWALHAMGPQTLDPAP